MVSVVLEGISAGLAATHAAAAAAKEAATKAAPAAAAAPLVAAIEVGEAAVAREALVAVSAKRLLTTPLHLAVHGNHLATAAVLFAAGARVEDIDGYGRSPVNLAVECRWPLGYVPRGEIFFRGAEHSENGICCCRRRRR